MHVWEFHDVYIMVYVRWSVDFCPNNYMSTCIYYAERIIAAIWHAFSSHVCMYGITIGCNEDVINIPYVDEFLSSYDQRTISVPASIYVKRPSNSHNI